MNNLISYDAPSKAHIAKSGWPEGEQVEILASNGLFLLDRVMCQGFLAAESITRAWGGERVLRGLEPIAESFKYHLPLIPAYVLEGIEEFFDWVVDTHATEAINLLYFSPKAPTEPQDRRWQCRAPLKQIVESGSVKKYVFPETPKGYATAGDIHSHKDFDAFHSWIDDKDEKNRTGLFITLGRNGSKLRRVRADYDCSFMVNGKRFALTPEQVFAEFAGKFTKQQRFPESWKFTVERPQEKKIEAAITSSILARTAAPILHGAHNSTRNRKHGGCK